MPPHVNHLFFFAMKTINFTILLTAFCSLLCAQESYFPATMSWKYLQEELCDDGTESHIATLQSSGTKEVFGKTCQLIADIPVLAEGSKIYVLEEKESGSEMKDTLILLYDFSLAVGDKIVWIESHGEVIPENMTDDTNGSLLREASVTSVETITLADGRSARRIHYDNRADDIEFVGSVNGVFAPLGLPVATCVKETFLCCSTADGLLFETSKGACESAVTVLDGINAGNVVRKVLENGSLFILYNGKRYSILGTESE